MIKLYAADTRELLSNFIELAQLVEPCRRARILQYGPNGSGLRCLAAGLLIRHEFGCLADHAIQTTTQGKPFLSGNRPFNLSHTGNYAVLGVSDHTIGIDIEHPHNLRYDRVAARCFHPRERDYLGSASDSQDAFFIIWTLKESYLKAEGCGFAMSPARNCILPVGEQDANFYEGSPYHFRRYRPFENYYLAVCALEDAFPDEITLLHF